MPQLSPVFNIPDFTDANGNPLSGGKVFQYEAGSFSVLKETYTTVDGDVANANPIVLDSAGRLPAGVNIWLTNGEAYNLVLTEADGTTVLKSFDNVTGVPVPSGGGDAGVSVWVEVPGGTFLSGTSFLVPGNYTAEFAAGNRVRLTLSTGFTYGTVQSVSFSSPNTVVTIINDGVALNSSLSVAEYSILIANNETVDAGGVSYVEALPYSTANTVGWKIKGLEATIGAGGVTAARSRLVYTTTGTGDTYVITPSPAITSYTTEAHWVVKFTNAASGASTLNVNSVGAKAIKQYTAAGALEDAVIAAGQVSEVAFDSANDCWILLDQLPAAAAAAAPRGMQVFASNGTFTTPAGVYYIKVTCVGGGGGGGAGDSTYDGGDSGTYTNRTGGGGGGGAVCWAYFSTTPGTNYSVSVGAAGAGGTSSYFGPSTAATAGGTTSFGVTLMTAQGGFPGTNASGSNWGSGGAGGGTGAGLVIRGANGIGGQLGAFGGFSPGYGAPSREYGGGGAGGGAVDASPSNGANGFQGLCVVEW